MKILVTGAAGFIGFHTCLKLVNQGHDVYGIDNINDYYDPKLKFDRLNELGFSESKSVLFNKEIQSDDPNQHAGKRRMHILSEITKLRQACCHPMIIEPQLEMTSSKLEKLDQMLEELLENNHKVYAVY